MPEQQPINRCPNCGYPLEIGEHDCPNAPGQDLNQETETVDGHAQILASEAKQKNRARPLMRKLLGRDKQTPEMRAEMESNLSQELMRRIESFDPSKKEKDNANFFPYRMQCLIKMLEQGVDKAGNSDVWFSFKEKVSKINDPDVELMRRIIARPEVKEAVLSKMEDYLLALPRIEHYRLDEMNQYFSLMGGRIRPRLADMMAKSDSNQVESMFKEKNALNKRLGFKEMLADDEQRNKILSGSYAILDQYSRLSALEGENVQNNDPFFLTPEARNVFLVQAIKYKNDALVRNRETYERTGLLDDPETYRFFLQYAEDRNSITGLIADIEEQKNTHEAAKIIFDPAEWKEASPAVLNWMTRGANPEYSKHSKAPKSDESRAAFDRYETILNSMAEPEQLTKGNQYFTRKFEVGTTMEDAVKQFLALSSLTGRQEDIERSRQVSERLYALYGQAVKKIDLGETFLNRGEELPKGLDHLLRIADATSRLDPENRESFEREISKIISVGTGMIHLDRSILESKEFRDKFSLLKSLGGYRNYEQEQKLGQLDDDTNKLHEFAVYAGRNWHDDRFDKEIYYHLSQFVNYGDVMRAKTMLVRFAGQHNEDRMSSNFLRVHKSSPEEIGKVQQIIEKFQDERRAKKYAQLYFDLRSSFSHEEAVSKTQDIIDKYSAIDPVILSVNWIDAPWLVDENNYQFVKQAYGKFGSQSLDFTNVFATKLQKDRKDLPASEGIAVIEKYHAIDDRLLHEPWIGGQELLNDNIYAFAVDGYKRFGHNAPDYTKLFIERLKVDPALTADKAIDFLAVAIENNFPIRFEYQPQYEASRQESTDQVWIQKMHTMSDDMAHARPLEKKERGTPEYRALIRGVYPESDYSRYGENEKLADNNDHLEQYTFAREGYRMVMSGVRGYERTQPRDGNYEELLAQYQKRIDTIKGMAASPDAVYKVIDEMREKMKLPTFMAEGKDKARLYGADLLELLMDQQDRKRKQIPLELSDQEIADLAIAYHMRGWGNEFVQGTADQVSASESQDTKDYIQWDALSKLFVEDGKQTLTTLYQSLKSDEEGQKVLSALADHYRSDETMPIERITERLAVSQEALKGTLSKITDTAKHRGVVIKRVTNDVIGMSQEMLKGLSANDRTQAQAALKEFIEGMVPQEGDYLQAITDPSTAQKLLATLQEYSFHPLQAVEKVLAADIGVVQREVGSYRTITEQDQVQTRKGVKTVEKQQTARKIVGYFSKTAEVANARAAARICIAVNTEMWNNKDYFEFVMFNEETKTCEGTVMLLNMQESDGKKYLLYCPNPSEHLLTQVSYEDCYKQLTPVIINFARENGFDGLVLSEKVEGASTNRTGGFASTLQNNKLKKSNGELEYAPVKKVHSLSKGYDYGGSGMKLNYIWKR
ncbi:MAG: hemophore-related protein [Patescibacteria group bacterium]|jgi:hypothetical protein